MEASRAAEPLTKGPGPAAGEGVEGMEGKIAGFPDRDRDPDLPDHHPRQAFPRKVQPPWQSRSNQPLPGFMGLGPKGLGISVNRWAGFPPWCGWVGAGPWKSGSDETS